MMASRQPSAALFTDLNELTMAQAYWQSGQTASATFSLFFRKYPPDSAYFVFAGLSPAREMRKQGHRLQAIRLDSGDMLDL